MRKKFLVLLALAIAIPVSLVSCKPSTPLTVMEQIQKKLTGMKSYKTNATVKNISNKGEITYETKQACDMSGRYKVEFLSPEDVKGSIIINDGKTVSQYNPRVENKIVVGIKESNARNEMFLDSFMKNYMQSEGTTVKTANINESLSTVLEAALPGGSDYLHSEKLWIDNTTLLPIQLIIYDKSGKERVIVLFEEFMYNADIDDSTFTFPE